MKCTSALVGTVAALALVTTPLSSASAHGHHRDGGLLFGLAALGAAAVVGVATIVTAPVRALAAAPAPVYAPPPGYAYAPPPGYAYVPPPVYAAPAYAAPPGYVYVR